jgi:hypothetical protein
VRYAPPGRELAVPDLSADVSAVRAALQAGSARGVQLRALLFPPSTLRWASSSVGEQLGTAMDRVDDAISAVTRPLRRRAAAR